MTATTSNIHACRRATPEAPACRHDGEVSQKRLRESSRPHISHHLSTRWRNQRQHAEACERRGRKLPNQANSVCARRSVREKHGGHSRGPTSRSFATISHFSRSAPISSSGARGSWATILRRCSSGRAQQTLARSYDLGARAVRPRPGWGRTRVSRRQIRRSGAGCIVRDPGAAMAAHDAARLCARMELAYARCASR